jgi:transcriptional regulator with XRE-family HTH domain
VETRNDLDAVIEHDEVLGMQIKLLRTQRRLRLRDLAKAAGISSWHLCKIEAGRHTPHRSTLEAIARGLSVDITGFEPDQVGPREKAALAVR